MATGAGRSAGGAAEAVVAALRSGPRTRAALGAATGLSRPSVSSAVARLIADGVVEEMRGAPRGRGRPSARLRLSRRRAVAIGIELGRRHSAVALVDAAGEVIAADERPVSPRSTLETRAARSLELLAELASREDAVLSDVRTVAVGTPGPRYTGASGRPAFDVTRLGRERERVAEIVGRRLGARVEVGNNTRYTALAVARRHGADVALLYLRVDEGVGGGVVERGVPVTGAAGTAGELGHVTLDPTGPRCPCGGRGCLELVAALPAILRRAGADDLDELLARADDPLVRDAIERAAVATGGVLAGAVATVDPTVVVVGGSVAGLPGFLPTLERVVRDCAPAWAADSLVVHSAPVDHLLGAVGAATTAFELAADRVPVVGRTAEGRTADGPVPA